jgi:integrase
MSAWRIAAGRARTQQSIHNDGPYCRTARRAKFRQRVLILAYTGLRFGELTGLNVEDVDLQTRRIRARRSITQLSGRLLERPPKSRAGRRSLPIPERLISILECRIEGRTAGEPAIVSPKGSRLGLENWKRAVGWRSRIAEIGRPTMRVHDLRHTYASLARSAGRDLKLLQVTMGHASIVVTAHTYADLYDSDLDRVADALDGLGG